MHQLIAYIAIRRHSNTLRRAVMTYGCGDTATRQTVPAVHNSFTYIILAHICQQSVIHNLYKHNHVTRHFVLPTYVLKLDVLKVSHKILCRTDSVFVQCRIVSFFFLDELAHDGH